MGDVERIVVDEMSQVEQCAAIRDTHNGPTLHDEETILAEVFGPPDPNGIYQPGGDS